MGSFSSFLRSRTIPVASELPIVDLPTPSTIGSGLSYLNGHPLPIEVWLSTPTGTTPTVMGCGDTGGQCLIRRDTLVTHAPDVEIRAHPGSGGPSFGGIGGGVLQPLGFALLAVYIPNGEALLGDVTNGRVIRALIEFQVIEELDCNFLIGRDATRAYGIDFIESNGVIRIGDMVVPIADCPSKSVEKTLNNSVLLAEDVTVPAHSDVLIPVYLSSRASIPPQHALLFSPGPFVDLPRDLHGRIPHTLMSSDTSALVFSNLCGYPMRLAKGRVVGSVQVLAPNTRMTYFASPADAAPRTDPPFPAPAKFCGLHVSPDPVRIPSDPDAILAEPFGLSAEVSVDDCHVDRVHLQLDEDERPGHDFDALTVTVDKSLTPPMRDQLVSVIRRFAGCFSFGGRRLGKVDLPPMSISINSIFNHNTT